MTGTIFADAIVDKGAGMWAAIAVLAALHDRAKAYSRRPIGRSCLGSPVMACSRHSQSSSVEANGSTTSASQRTPRVANRSALEAMIEEALSTRNRDEWVELLGSNGIPCAPILDPAEAFHHPQVQALRIFQSPPDLEMPLVSAPWSINGVRPPVRRRAPLLGEDNEVVLRKRPARCSPAD